MSDQVARSEQHSGGNLGAVALAALGVVYGDIGTSPLYAFRESFVGHHKMEVSEANVFGVLSLVFWSLALIISVKYMLVVLRADNRGEGGILALLSLAVPRGSSHRKAWVALGLFGAALLYGDGVITPAISVLSAVEGLKLVTPFFDHYVVPITIAILCTLFGFQKFGTAKIGAVFGPIILIWFATIGCLGIFKVAENPSVLLALNPIFAIQFFVENPHLAFLSLGSLFLVVTGGEALYADMGHFGKRPIRWAWFTIVLPGLLLNYLGQGALLLQDPSAIENPFFLLAPKWALIPLVILATFATVIASQALISGVYSLTNQAIQLGFSPRMQIVYTSSREMGQIYMPQVNWALLVATIWLVLTFRSSSNLAAAYGVSVSATMVITTLLLWVVMREVWKWSLATATLVTVFFLVIDFSFFAANIIKIEQGGWFPLLLGTVMFTMMTTWRKGREILADRLRARSIPLKEFIQEVIANKIVRVPGAALFMVGDPQTTPPALVHNVKHNKVLHEKVIVLTVLTKEIPHVPLKDRVQIEPVVDHIFKVIVQYGFMDTPNIMTALRRCNDLGLRVDPAEVTFFLGRETLIASSRPGMAIWREHLFSFMSKNSQRATTFFHIPVDQVIEVGMQVEL